MLTSVAVPALHPAAATLITSQRGEALSAAGVSVPEDVRRLLAIEPSLLRYVDTQAQASAQRAKSTWSLLARRWEEGAD